jgi:RNA chaperone ProQ/FINO-like protein
MRPTRLDSSKLLRRPTTDKTVSSPRTPETKTLREHIVPPTAIITRPQTESGAVVIRRRGKVTPPVTARVHEQPAKVHPGARKVYKKKAPPPPAPPRALYRIIMEQWPVAFPARPDEVRPLAIGIHEVLEKKFPDRTPEQVRRAIAQWRYPRLGAYLRVIVRGGPRYDLDGNPSGEVTESEQENARQRLKEWRARRKAQAAAAVPSLGVGSLEPTPLPSIADDL